MKTLQQLMGMPVVTVLEGLRLGTLKGVEFNAADGQIRYLLFDGADTRADGVVPWSAVRSVGADAITVESLAGVLDAVPAADREAITPELHDRTVMTESGTSLGKVTGYELDEATGRIERYHVATGGLLGRLTGSKVSFSRSEISAFGPDAIVVVDSVDPTVRKTQEQH